MIRETTREAYQKIKENGLLSKRRLQVYEALMDHGPCTATELARRMGVNKGAQSNQNVVTRLGELRDSGCVDELQKRICSETGYAAYEWMVNDNLPVKLDKPKKIKCTHCKGKGHFIEQQTRMF